MTSLSERLFVSRNMPDLRVDEVPALLEPKLSVLRKYFFMRDEIEQQLLEEGYEPQPLDDVGFADEDMSAYTESYPTYAIIRKDGTVVLGPRIELHLEVITEKRVVDPRAQLQWLARELDNYGCAEKYPFVTATTYPKLARAAHVLTGMEFALATYFPPIDVSQTNVQDIHAIERAFQIRNGIQPTADQHIESLTMPTRDFIDRLTS